jgi:hypothetical protein
MATYETGYPSTDNVVNQHAYKLGCSLLDVQDRLLTRDRNKHVRAALQLDLQFQTFRVLCFDLDAVVEGRTQCAAQVAGVLDEVKTWIHRLEGVAARVGV